MKLKKLARKRQRNWPQKKEEEAAAKDTADRKIDRLTSSRIEEESYLKEGSPKNKPAVASITLPPLSYIPTCHATPTPQHVPRPMLSSIKVYSPSDYLGRALPKQWTSCRGTHFPGPWTVLRPKWTSTRTCMASPSLPSKWTFTRTPAS